MQIVDEFNFFSKKYQNFRPSYPENLFTWISETTLEHELVIDCGTGNGQAAIPLSRYFNRVIAIDSNENQLEEAVLCKNIEYKKSPAEKIDLLDASADLIVAASSAHWFNLDLFYKECKRILKPDGRIIIWTYTWPETENLKMSFTLLKIKEQLNPYWSKESLYHINKYKNLPFPFKQYPNPEFQFSKEWTSGELLDFLLTWACISHIIKTVDNNFKYKMKKIITNGYNGNEKIRFDFPLYVKAGIHLV